MGKVQSTKDLIMLLLYAKGHRGQQAEPVRGRTRLMKMVFLFKMEVRRKFNMDKAVPQAALPDFIPYDYGPFSPQVFTDVDFLADLGLVQVKRVGASLQERAIASQEYEHWRMGEALDESDEVSGEEEFSLSIKGKGFVEEKQAGELSPQQWTTLNELKARCTAAPLKALLRYVYTNYPKYSTESEIRNQILSEGSS